MVVFPNLMIHRFQRHHIEAKNTPSERVRGAFFPSLFCVHTKWNTKIANLVYNTNNYGLCHLYISQMRTMVLEHWPKKNYAKHSWGFDVGQYSITMEHLGFSYSCFFYPRNITCWKPKWRDPSQVPTKSATKLTDN